LGIIEKGVDMKKVITISILFVLVAYCSLTSYAHSGGTDSRGGHYNRKMGGYHYHHGMGPHQHPNGKCPYTGSSLVIRILVIGGIIVGAFLIWAKITSVLSGDVKPQSPSVSEAHGISYLTSVERKIKEKKPKDEQKQ
jgi:hypothetical protein